MMTKHPAMYLTLLCLWAGILLYFDPRLLALLISPESWLAKSWVLLFVGTLNICWLYACYLLSFRDCLFLATPTAQ